MYWLVFYNGFDKPEVEAAFAYPWLLCSYVDGYCDRGKFYIVFTPSKKIIPLEKFYKKHKEK